MRRARPLLAAVLAIVAVAPTRSRADDLADEADIQFELGTKKYQAGDYLGALENFLTSNRLVPNKNVLYNIARCYEQLARFPDAYRAYGRALDVETDPEQRKTLEAALARIAPKIALLEVTTDPPGATLYLNRKDLGPRGSTPRRLGLDKGKYKVLVELDGYEPAESQEVNLSVGTVTKVALKLEPILATLVVEGDDVGAAVRLDDAKGAPLCAVPCKVRVAPGHHVLHVARSGFKSVEIPVDLAAKQTTTVRPRLDVLTGVVVVNTDVRDALIEIDGKPYGFTPAVLQVPVGTHTMTVSRSGFKAVTRTIVVQVSGQTRVDASLTEVSEVSAASRAQEAVEDAPSSVSIVPSAELRGMGYPTIADALLGVRGVYLTDDRHYTTVGFRGFSHLGDYGNRVLVLVDGHPINDNYIGSAFVGFDARTDLEDVERIEVVRGPGSVLYGTGAFFGVVNLVTRSRGAPTRVEAGVSAVHDAVARARVAANYRFNADAGVWTSFSGARGRGRDFFFPEFQQAGVSDGWARDVDAFDAGTWTGRAWWKAFTVQWSAHERKKILPGGAYDTNFGDPNTVFRDRRSFIEARFEPKLSKAVQSFSRVHGNMYDFRGTYAYQPIDGGLNVERYRGQWFGVEQRFVFSPSEALRFTVGAELIRHTMTRMRVQTETELLLDRPDNNYTVGAAYLLASVAPVPRIKLEAGARLDWYSFFGASVNPRVAIITRPWDDGVVKLLGGKAFRAPSIYERFFTSATQSTPPVPLKPEDVWSGEVEVSHRFSPTVVASLSSYANYVNDLIVLLGSGTTDARNYYANSDQPVLTTGVEAELRRDFRDGWMLAGHASYQKARYMNNDGSRREVPNSPEVLASIRGAVPIVTRAIALTSRLTFVGPRWDRYDRATDPEQMRTDPALLLDVVFTGEAERSGIRYGLGIYNAFDWRWHAPVSREFVQRMMPQSGRTVFASLSIAL